MRENTFYYYYFFNLKNPEEKENIDKHSAVLMVQDSGGFEHRDDRLHSHQDFALSVTVDSEIQPSASESTMFKVMYNVYSKKQIMHGDKSLQLKLPMYMYLKDFGCLCAWSSL